MLLASNTSGRYLSGWTSFMYLD